MTTTNTRSAMKFRKRPIVIEAILWNGNNLRDVIEFTNGPPNLRTQHARMRWDDYESLVQDSGLRIYTLEGAMLANVGDMIVRGVQGELYPCKPDIFAATYDPVDPTLIEAATAPENYLPAEIVYRAEALASDAAKQPDHVRRIVAGIFSSVEAATAEQGAGRREEISDLEGLAILLDGYARDRKRDKLPKTSDVLAAAASHLRAYAAALRPSASAGGLVRDAYGNAANGSFEAACLGVGSKSTTRVEESPINPDGEYTDKHLDSCMLSKDVWDLSLFTAAEIECTCDFEGRASNEICMLRELLADALKLASGKEFHMSDCATSDAPAATPGPCNCLTPSPVVAEVDGAAQEMLVAFAEGVEWTDEKRAAYDALNRALSVVPEVAK